MPRFWYPKNNPILGRFITVEIVEADRQRILWALDKMKSAVQFWIKGEMLYRGAVDYRNLLHYNVTSQKFAASYARYNTKYEEWKREGGNLDFWILKGDFLRSLTVWRTGIGYYSGVPSGVMDTGGKSWLYPRSGTNKGPSKPIAWYARFGEFGRMGQPERPIFGPTLDEYAQTGWPKRGEEALQNIGKSWY